VHDMFLSPLQRFEKYSIYFIIHDLAAFVKFFCYTTHGKRMKHSIKAQKEGHWP